LEGTGCSQWAEIEALTDIPKATVDAVDGLRVLVERRSCQTKPDHPRRPAGGTDQAGDPERHRVDRLGCVLDEAEGALTERTGGSASDDVNLRRRFDCERAFGCAAGPEARETLLVAHQLRVGASLDPAAPAVHGTPS
jgi:hypothetical protein